MLEQLEQWDRALFLFFNGFHSSTLDLIMWNVSGKLQWIPLYILLLYFVIKKYGKQSWIIIIAAAITVTLADQISVKLFKEVFERWRPCHNFDLEGMVHIVNNKCGGRFGFVSSHAANTFAVAGLLGAFISNRTLYFLLMWAALVAYSRVYLGVHYPADIFGGAILGLLISYLIYHITIKFIKPIRSA